MKDVQPCAGPGAAGAAAPAPRRLEVKAHIRSQPHVTHKRALQQAITTRHKAIPVIGATLEPHKSKELEAAFTRQNESRDAIARTAQLPHLVVLQLLEARVQSRV